MTIQTDITLKDFKMFGRHVAYRAGGKSWMYVTLIGTGAVAGALVGLFLRLLGVQLDFINFMAGLLTGVLWLLIFSQLYKRRMAPLADSYFLGPQTVSLADDGITVKSQKQDALLRWNSVRWVDSTTEYIFVMLERHIGMIVPCRAFSSNEERERFLAEVRKRAGAGNASGAFHEMS